MVSVNPDPIIHCMDRQCRGNSNQGPKRHRCFGNFVGFVDDWDDSRDDSGDSVMVVIHYFCRYDRMALQLDGP